MTIKKRYVDVLTGTSHVGAGAVSGEARGLIGLGAVYGRVVGFEFKGDDTDVDTNNTLALSDADGRVLLTAVALDGGTDDGTLKNTQQNAIIGTTVSVASTFGVGFDLVCEEDRAMGSDGVATTDNVGAGSGGRFAKSPVTATIVSGTDGDWHRVTLYVEV
ncbi:MAG: hypothetical protein V4510_12965 [bacterium]